jgi:Methyltransferase FkbM domain
LRLAQVRGAHTLSPEQEIADNTIPIEPATLDTLLARCTVARVDVIKIDSQSWELQALRGACKTLVADSPAVLLVNLPKQPGQRSAIGEYAARLGLRLYRDFEFSAPTTTLPPGITEIVAMPAPG